MIIYIKSIGYYGISMSSTNFGGNIFVSFILACLVEIPSYIYNILVMDHWGRKPIFVSSLLLTGIATIPAAFLSDGAGKTVMALIGKVKLERVSKNLRLINGHFPTLSSHFLAKYKNG